jgi:NitT/TauT family transport system permease protein
VATERTFPTSGALGRRAVGPVDLLVGAGIIGVLFAFVRLSRSLSVAFVPGRTKLHLNTGISHLPYYAAESLFRMLAALLLSTIFTFVFATAAARLRRAEKVLVPLLDILQSVPILGFLTFTVVFFLRLFPGSLLGLEFASIFAVFTSQAWNMTFSFYHSLISQPSDLDEAARMYRLTKWQRFWKLDVPSSMIGLVWNAMMSMGGGWFFLTLSEAITVGSHSYTLPGMGSYIGEAIQDGSISKVCIAIAVMIAMVIGLNVLLFRPLVAWAEKFRLETSESGDKPHSIVLDLLRRSAIPRLMGRVLRPVGRLLDRLTRPFGLAEYPLAPNLRRRRAGDVAYFGAITLVVGWGAWLGLAYIGHKVGFSAFPYVFGLGAITFARVVVVVVVSTLIWVPVGVKIGLSPRLARFAQPVVQILASFPANLLFPFAVILFIALHIPLDFGGILLMALGSQWYVLFNTIAGAIAIPNDLREMAASLRLTRRQRWEKLILPAIFPAYVTGGITAAGGAWNASIVAEVAGWGSHHLSAIGLGAYIADAADSSGPDHFGRVLIGVVVMSIFVVGVNRLFWRRLYRLAETRYSL